LKSGGSLIKIEPVVTDGSLYCEKTGQAAATSILD
jgi:hypothetical protein